MTTLSSGWAFFAPGSPTADRLREERAVDLHEGRAGRLEVGADELVRLALDDLDDLALGIRAARSRFLLQPHQHRVAGGGVAGVARRR